MAESIRRNLIAKVGGAACTGSVLGVNIFSDTIYAFRNDVNGLAATMWKNTSTGWEQIDLGTQIRFVSGVTEINEGDALLAG
jgi:hypothetical protein